jgi:uncharacterized membrane protein YphA (DoxX/SURF4 family)
MFGPPKPWGQYAYVVLRIVIAVFWLNSSMPRWFALTMGHPVANGMVRGLFGSGMVVPLTYLFTLLETLGAVALILGLLTRLVSVWAVVEFAVTGTTGLMIGQGGLIKDFGLMAGALVLLMNGSQRLSLDGLFAKNIARVIQSEKKLL